MCAWQTLYHCTVGPVQIEYILFPLYIYHIWVKLSNICLSLSDLFPLILSPSSIHVLVENYIFTFWFIVFIRFLFWEHIWQCLGCAQKLLLLGLGRTIWDVRNQTWSTMCKTNDPYSVFSGWPQDYIFYYNWVIFLFVFMSQLLFPTIWVITQMIFGNNNFQKW